MDSNLPNMPNTKIQTNTNGAMTRSFRPVKLSILALVFTFALVSAGGLFYFRFNNIQKVSEGGTADVFVAEPTDAGFTSIRYVDYTAFTPPLAEVPSKFRSKIDSRRTLVYDSGSEFRAQMGDRFCDIDDLSCKGWAWKYVCDVDPGIVWDVNGEGYSNRKCEKRHDGSNGVKFSKLVAPTSSETVYNLNDVGCGKLVQIDLTEGNAEPFPDNGAKNGDNNHIYDYLVYYTGTCVEEVQCVTYDYIGDTTSGWDECNYCIDENNDGMYDLNPTQSCLQREVACRQKTYNRLNNVYPSRVSMYPTPTAINNTDDTSRILWFNWAVSLIKHQDTYPNEHIISEGTACGNGEICCTAPTPPTPTPTPTPPPPTPTPPTPTPVETTISCDSLTGVAKNNAGVEVDLNALPNDFTGTLDLTCVGSSTGKDITKVTFVLDKTVDGNTTSTSKDVTGDGIKLDSQTGDIKTFSTSTTFNITGQGTYSASSKVCNEDNLCSQ